MGKANILFMLSAKENNLWAKQSAERIAFHSADHQPVHSNISKANWTLCSTTAIQKQF